MAKRSHPDVDGGDVEAMRRLNEAADIILEELGAVAEGNVSAERGLRRLPDRAGRRVRVVSIPTLRSFVIEALPVVAFEALFVVTSWIGEVVVDESPDQLDVLVLDPFALLVAGSTSCPTQGRPRSA